MKIYRERIGENSQVYIVASSPEVGLGELEPIQLMSVD